ECFVLLWICRLYVGPERFAGFGIESDHAPIAGAAKNPSIQVPGATLGGGRRKLLEIDDVLPAQLACSRIDRVSSTQRGNVERAPHFQQAAAEHYRLIEPNLADLFQLADISRRDLVQIDVTLAGIVLIHGEPPVALGCILALLVRI